MVRNSGISKFAYFQGFEFEKENLAIRSNSNFKISMIIKIHVIQNFMLIGWVVKS